MDRHRSGASLLFPGSSGNPSRSPSIELDHVGGTLTVGSPILLTRACLYCFGKSYRRQLLLERSLTDSSATLFTTRGVLYAHVMCLTAHGIRKDPKEQPPICRLMCKRKTRIARHTTHPLPPSGHPHHPRHLQSHLSGRSKTAAVFTAQASYSAAWPRKASKHEDPGRRRRKRPRQRRGKPQQRRLPINLFPRGSWRRRLRRGTRRL